MRLMRRLAALVVRGPRSTRSVAACAAALVLGALVAGSSAGLAAAAPPALAGVSGVARVANSPGSALASAVPSTAIPAGRVTFAVSCASPSATAATLAGRTLGLTSHIQMQPSSAAGEFTVSVILPGSIRPGTYYPSLRCSDGTSATARLLVPAFATGAQGGGARSTAITVGGLVLLAIGAVSCCIALRRRKLRRSAADSGQADGEFGYLDPRLGSSGSYFRDSGSYYGDPSSDSGSYLVRSGAADDDHAAAAGSSGTRRRRTRH
jgi:hypothetical protein